MAAKIEPALAEKLKAGVPEINVEIQFSETPPAAQMQALGLRSEGKIAWGILRREKLEAIAAVPQVVSMRLSKRAVEPIKPPTAAVGPALAAAMQVEPNGRHRVLVRFRRPPNALPSLEDFSVRENSGDGYLSREEIESLARHEDVLTIDLFPEVKLM